MCRISGAYDKDNISRLRNVERMNRLQKAGGPDGDLYVDDSNNHITFAHRRLAIIDLTQRGEQPVFNKQFTMTYNGEFYSYKNEFPNAPNDTLALFESICALGIKRTLSLIDGMFAFAVYDQQEKQIHCVVDHFAQKPLFYYHTKNKFYFASWPAALYDLEQSWELDREALQSYWLLGSVMGDNSLFRGIKKLNASEWLTYDIQTDTITIQRYWQPKFQDNTNDIEDLIFDAIDKVKISDVPIHIFLSGGIDSTLVASRFQGGQAIHLDSPELNYAQHVADKFNIQLKHIHPKQIDVEACYTDYVTKSGLPSMACLQPYITAKEVSKHGKVAISANGADELFFGYSRTHDNLGQFDINHMYRMSANFPPQPKGIAIPVGTFGQGRRFELASYVQFDLNQTLDFASMCHGLEVRNPFLDHRLVEMALSIPEAEHRKEGNKTILKRILSNLGFDDKFLNRPKLGFSLYSQPENLESLVSQAWKWVQQNGFLQVEEKKLTPRDKKYLEMSALGFWYWWKVWQNKIK